MEELLQRLEKQIKKMLEQYDQLTRVNHQLYQNKFQITHEKDLLLARQQKAIIQIQTLVSRLKAIESE